MSKVFAKAIPESDKHLWTNSPQAPLLQVEPDRTFVKCHVVRFEGNDIIVKQTEPLNSPEFKVSNRDGVVYRYNDQLSDPKSITDIGNLPHKNEACVVDLLRQRFLAGHIYTTAEPLLVAINPFKDLGLCNDAKIAEYRDAPDVSRLPPHVYRIAREALQNYHTFKKSQTIIVSGESGSGKTEATKHVMRYFANARTVRGGTPLDVKVQTAVMAANPVLEAFGNAKTIRNNNSSRFGRWMQLDVGKMGGIQAGQVRSFLLEKSRVVTQEDNERGYHIFYFLLKGADPKMREALKLDDPSKYRFVNPDCLDVKDVNDAEEFKIVMESLKSMGLTPDEIKYTFSIVSGILALGNVKIVGVEDKATGIDDAAKIQNPEQLDKACQLCFLNPEDVRKQLMVQEYRQAGEAKVITKPLSFGRANTLKESLAKGLYEKLFEWLVRKLNTNIVTPAMEQSTSFIGMLDIFGFEVFDVNSLEQLFINIANEMLQKNFTDVVFDKETRLYREEGIKDVKLEYKSNTDVITLLASRQMSILSLLVDQCVVNTGSDEGFMASCFNNLKSEKLKRYKTDNAKFTIGHTIGAIDYSSKNFILKNNDVLKGEMVDVINASENIVTKSLFEGVVVKKGNLGKENLISATFLRQLDELVKIINSTESHFIRCVKPNEDKAPLTYINSKVLLQLFSLSVLEALALKDLGFSYRRRFDEFLDQFRYVDIGITNPALESNDLAKSKQASQALLQRSPLAKEDWAVGKTMTFLTSKGVKELQDYQRRMMSQWAPLISTLESMWKRQLMKKDLSKNSGNLVRVQAHCKKMLQLQRDGGPKTQYVPRVVA